MGVDLAALRAKLDELKTGQKTDTEYLEKYVMLEDGENVLRFLPGKADEPFYAETSIHRVNGKNLHCLGRKDCPICAYVSKLYDSKIDENIELARRIKAKKRFYFNAIQREAKNRSTGEVEKDVGPKIFSCGIKLFEKILATFVDSDFGDLTDLAEGWDYKVIKKDKDNYPNYDDSRPRPKSTPASENVEQVREWMDNLHDLQALIVHKSKEELIEDLKTLSGEGDSSPAAPVEPTTASVQGQSQVVVETPVPVSVDDSSDEDTDDFLAELKKIKEGK